MKDVRGLYKSHWCDIDCRVYMSLKLKEGGRESERDRNWIGQGKWFQNCSWRIVRIFACGNAVGGAGTVSKPTWLAKAVHVKEQESYVEVKSLSRVWLFVTLCSPPGSPVHGILQARVLEWIAISFSRASSRPRDWTQFSCIAGRRFNLWATREAPLKSRRRKQICRIRRNWVEIGKLK